MQTDAHAPRRGHQSMKGSVFIHSERNIMFDFIEYLVWTPSEMPSTVSQTEDAKKTGSCMANLDSLAVDCLKRSVQSLQPFPLHFSAWVHLKTKWTFFSLFRHLLDGSLIAEHHIIICTPFMSLIILLHFLCWAEYMYLFSFVSFYFSDGQRAGWLLKGNNSRADKMFQPYWANVVLPLLRLSQQEVWASLTGTRTLPLFQKDVFALLCKSFWALTGENSVGKYVGNFHRRECLSTFLEPEKGLKNERPLLFCPFFHPPLPKWYMVSSQEIRANVHLCPAHITSAPLNLGSHHVLLKFGKMHRPGRWIWIQDLKKRKTVDLRMILKVRY